MVPLGTLICPRCQNILGRPDIPTHQPNLPTGPITDIGEISPEVQRSGEATTLLMATKQQSAQPSRLRITRRLEDAIKRFHRQERYIAAGTVGVIIASLVTVVLIVTLIHGLKASGPPSAQRPVAETATQPQTTPVASQDPPTAIVTATPTAVTATPTVVASPTKKPASSTPIPATATPLPANAATFLQTDTTHEGTWNGVYGQAGADVIKDGSTVPNTIQITVGGTAGTWSSSTTDARALQKISLSGRIAAYLDSTTSFTIDINITDGQTHQLALYVLDWDKLGRAERIDILDGDGETVLDSENVADFSLGEYLVWNVRGHIILRVTNTAGTSKNAVVSGLFFG
jgi:hypothetical protein